MKRGSYARYLELVFLFTRFESLSEARVRVNFTDNMSTSSNGTAETSAELSLSSASLL